MKFLDIFNEVQKGDYALTDEAMYISLQNNDELIPLYGGNKTHNISDRKISISAKTSKGKNITIFQGEGIIISLDGSAGNMTYKNNEKFSLNHHAGFITLKNNCKNQVDLMYFSIFFQNFYKSLAVSAGSKTLSLNQIYLEEFDLPDINKQKEIVSLLKHVSPKIYLLNEMMLKLEKLKNKTLLLGENTKFIFKNISINTFSKIIQGHQITDEEIYNSAIGNIPIYTGANEVKGYWDKYIVSKECLPCLTYATKAFDGTITIQRDLFDANNTAVLYLKDKYKEYILLEWLQIILQPIFLDKATSKDGISYLNKEIIEQECINIPILSEQEKMIELYKKVNDKIATIETIKSRYNNLINKELLV